MKPNMTPTADDKLDDQKSKLRVAKLVNKISTGYSYPNHDEIALKQVLGY